MVIRRPTSTGPPVGFSEVGTFHVHIDGGREEELVRDLIHWIQENTDRRAKITKIEAAIPGPQRVLLPDVYGSHTPGESGVEEFEYFSTILAQGRKGVYDLMEMVLSRLGAVRGIVCEGERVIARYDSKRSFVNIGVQQALTFEPGEVPFALSPSWPIEVHHATNIPKLPGETAPPVDLATMLSWFTSFGAKLGGMFRFARKDYWCYRTNEFFNGPEYLELLKAHSDAFRQKLDELGYEHETKAIAEQVLAICHT